MATKGEQKAKKKNKQRRLTGRTPKPSTSKNVRYSKEQAEGKESRESSRKIRKVLKTEGRVQSQRNSVSHSEGRASLENSRRLKAMRIECWRLNRRKSEGSRKETGKEQMKAEKNGEVDTNNKEDDVAEDNESRRNSRPAPPPSTEREKKSETNSEGKDEKEIVKRGNWRETRRTALDSNTETSSAGREEVVDQWKEKKGRVLERVTRTMLDQIREAGKDVPLGTLLLEIRTKSMPEIKAVEVEEKRAAAKANNKTAKAEELDGCVDQLDWYYGPSQVPEQPHEEHGEGNGEEYERLAIPAEDHLEILARECPPLWLDTLRRIVGTFGDKPRLAVKVYDGVRRMASDERRPVNGGAPCGICHELLFDVNLHPHRTELCFLREYEDRYIFVTRCQADRCEVCRKRKQANHVCRFPAEECRECKKAGVIGRRDHRRHIGKCEVIDFLYSEIGRVPTESEIAEYVRRDGRQCQIMGDRMKNCRDNYFEVQEWIRNGCQPVQKKW